MKQICNVLTIDVGGQLRQFVCVDREGHMQFRGHEGCCRYESDVDIRGSFYTEEAKYRITLEKV